MKVAVITLTRDRLAYTKVCFAKLRELAGHPFDHFVLDNGSTDGTWDWLREEWAAGRLRWIRGLNVNQGISLGCNEIIKNIMPFGYDAILKFDNDCMPETPNFLARMVWVAEAAPNLVLSPWVNGITSKPSTRLPFVAAGETLYLVGHCGGLCRLAPKAAHAGFSYPGNLPYASGQDLAFSRHALDNYYIIAYMKDVVVQHYKTTGGQERDPEMRSYFERKRREEREVPPRFE